MATNLPKYKRQCDNWLVTFRDWILPRSESPDQYIIWSGIFCIAAALRRRVIIPKKILGTWDCAPYMYMMFVGPAGMRKTTTARMGVDLMEPIPGIADPPTFITKEAIVDDIVLSPDSSVMLLIEEFSDIMQKGNSGEMYEFLTSMFDGKRKLQQKTLKRGLELADKPCINMLAATTPEWIAGNMPEGIIGGGFASRVVWIHADKLPRRGMYWAEIAEKFDLKSMEDALAADLAHIAENLEGEVLISKEVRDQVEHWYQKIHVPQEEKAPAKIAGFMRRKPVHLHKLATILHFARSDSMELEWNDFEAALTLLDDVQKGLSKVFMGIGKNPFTFDMRSIIHYVATNEKVTRQQILDEFFNAAPPRTLEELIQGCVASGNLDLTFDGKTVYYTIPAD